MENIKRIDGTGVVEGDIIEIIPHSDPVYLFHDGELDKITPQEFNILITVEKKNRAWELSCFRLHILKYAK